MFGVNTTPGDALQRVKRSNENMVRTPDRKRRREMSKPTSRKPRKAAYHDDAAVQAAYDRILAAVKDAEARAAAGDIPAPYIGTANVKTGAGNEGTASLVTCCMHARGTCGHECYAAWRIDNRLDEARRHHAENTVIRRLAPFAYYCGFLAFCASRGLILRVNETGDFETPDQLRALIRAAACYPYVHVIGYTRRPEMAPLLRELPDNVDIRYSTYRDGVHTAPAGVRVAAVDDVRTNCPSQVAADLGKTWTCSQCAACGGGCCCKSRLVQWFRAH